MTAAGPPPAVRVQIGDTVVARVAAQRARQVPGVVGLRADLGRTLRSVAGAVLGQPPSRLPTDGVAAVVRGGAAEVSVDVVTRLGHNCRDLAQAIQLAVADELTGYTGLPATVRVTVAEIVLD